jgi:hypothetical protein
VAVDRLAEAIQAEPTVLLPLRTMTGLLRKEFAWTTKLVAEPLGMKPLSENKVDSMERSGSATSATQARIAAETVDRIMHGGPPGSFKSKQDKPDTTAGWSSVRSYAANGVPYADFLHQRHYGGPFRQVIDAASELRGDLLEVGRPRPGPRWLPGSLADVGGCLPVAVRCRVAVQGGAYAIDDQVQPVLEGALAVG